MASYRRLMEELGGKSGDHRVAVLDAAKPYLLACLHRNLGIPVLVVTARAERTKRLCDDLRSWCGTDAPVRLFPEPDTLLYEHLASDPFTTQQRLQMLASLSGAGQTSQRPPLIVASAHAVAQKTPSHLDFSSACHNLRRGMQINRDQTIASWLGMGYQMEDMVEIPGTVSRRGGILDIYPPHYHLPARIELFGDEVESIRFFDPKTQRSVELVPSITIMPAQEILAGNNSPANDIFATLNLTKCNTEARQRIEDEIERLLRGEPFDGVELYRGLFNQGVIFDYLPQGSLLILDEPGLIAAEVRELDHRAMELRRGQVERGELPENFPPPYFTWSELTEKLDHVDRRLALTEWGADTSSLPAMVFAPAPTYGGRLRYGGQFTTVVRETREMLKEGRRIIIISQQASRLSELFREQGMFISPVPDIEQPPAPGSLVLVQGLLAEGWIMDGQRDDYRGTTLLTDAEIFGFAKQQRIVRRRAVHHLAFLSELSVGDYVVHIEHGVGRFAGMITMGVDGGEREYMLLEYAVGDKLYVPSDQVDRVSRYIGPGGYVPALSRLGTQEWARAKRRVREAAKNLAQELLSIYSLREIVPGFAFSSDTVWQQELEASFPYMETPDQLEAVQWVKRDMERPKPMDRLVCGDVGYGKTEVALRAAFKAVMDNTQVAILVPTTILAEQHFATFTQRLGAFPIKVEVLSRFRSDREQRSVLEGLANGTIDICIGTHRLLQKDVSFRNLGLVIIDEEQRFGVAHKEHLKQMRKEVDVLTLSATPIPRTLYMSLVGVRDVSTMETPPEERRPIKTYVSEYDERLIREAILRELDRGGQVFFVHNRVYNIVYVANRLAELIPEAKIAVAHGQMPEERLESVMLDFSAGNSDVLVCTTIIESGLDLPNVNTLIINQADKLGLAQLYQLRGRVGRGASRAYAYFLFNQGKRLTEAAEKRLRTIFEATELGAGFRIAMKDLEIRGAGNLLGAEQSGHIGSVGFNLYCRLLAEAVEELKANQSGAEIKPSVSPHPLPPAIDLPVPAYIPEEYVADINTRLTLYERLAKLSSRDEIDDMARELRDRFGEPPLEVDNLLYIVRIKGLATKAFVQSILREGKQIVIHLRDNVKFDRLALQQVCPQGLHIGLSQLRLDRRRLGSQWREALEQVLKLIIPRQALT